MVRPPHSFGIRHPCMTFSYMLYNWSMFLAVPKPTGTNARATAWWWCSRRELWSVYYAILGSWGVERSWVNSLLLLMSSILGFFHWVFKINLACHLIWFSQIAQCV
jgi:hypothetical protein